MATPSFSELTLRHSTRSEAVQTPSASTQSLIERLAGMLVGEPDNISLSCAEVREIILYLQPPTEANADTTNNRELIEAKNELKVLNAHRRLGDYASKVYNDLKEHTTDQPLPKYATTLSRLFQQEAHTGSKGANGRIMRAFEASVEYLAVEFDNNIDVDTAKFAVDAYSARNLAFHSKSMRLIAAADRPTLGHQISQDLEELASILPDGDGQHLDKWRRIICYFRDRHIVLGETGTWELRPEEKSEVDDVFDNPSRPTSDLAGLPTRIWQQAFTRGKLRDTPSFTVERRTESRSDPTQSQSISRKRAASGPLEDEKPPKSQCIEVESAETQKQKRLRAEHDAGYEGLINDIQELAGKHLGKSIALLQDCRGLHKRSFNELHQVDIAAKDKEEKAARRAAKKSSKSKG
jgi:hypothetical protein